MDAASLERELQAVTALVDSWSARRRQQASDLRDQHSNGMTRHSETMGDLKAQQAQLARAVESLHERLADETQQASSLEKLVQDASAERDALLQHLSLLQKALEKQEVACLERESEVMVEEKRKVQRTAALRQEVALYSSRLGLEFKQVPGGELKLVMTQIDRADPARPFQVSVRITDDNRYTVTKCNPSVARLPELVKQLNKTNQFSDFLRGLRIEFQALAASGGSA